MRTLSLFIVTSYALTCIAAEPQADADSFAKEADDSSIPTEIHILYRRQLEGRTLSVDGREVSGTDALLEAVKTQSKTEKLAGREVSVVIVTNLASWDEEITALRKAIVEAGAKSCTPINSDAGIQIRARALLPIKDDPSRTCLVEWAFSNFTMEPIEIPGDG